MKGAPFIELIEIVFFFYFLCRKKHRSGIEWLFIFFVPATMLAAQSIQLGLNDVVVAGGMESMSNAPKYLAEARSAFVSLIVY